MRTVPLRQKAAMLTSLMTETDPEALRVLRASVAGIVLAELRDGGHRMDSEPRAWSRSKAQTMGAFSDDAPGNGKVIRGELNACMLDVTRWETECAARLEMVLQSARWAEDAGADDLGRELRGYASRLYAHGRQLGAPTTVADTREVSGSVSRRYDLLPRWARRLL